MLKSLRGPLPAVLVAVLALAGCSTIPKVTSPTGVDVTITPMTTSQVRTYYGTNSTQDPNPFIPPGGLLSRQTQDYIVLRIQIAAAREAEVHIGRAIAEGSSGSTVAEAYSWRQFKQNMSGWYQQGRETQLRYTRGEQAYLPGGTLNVKPGRRSYILVLVGKHPMPKPVEVKVEVTVGLGKPQVFSFKAEPVGPERALGF